MNDIINIKEKFKVDDSHSKIRGFVCAYDENGKLVFSKENMIVESGRRFILNNGINENSLKYVQLGTSGTPASPDDTIASLNESVSDSIVKTTEIFPETLTLSNFEKLAIKSGLIEVSGEEYKENMIILSEDEDGDGFKEKETDTTKRVRDDKNYFSYFIDHNQLVINCFICFNGKESITARSLGIIAHYPEKSTAVDSEGNSLANQDVLFSRVTFPTYYKSNHQRLTFKYYIYF